MTRRCGVLTVVALVAGCASGATGDGVRGGRRTGLPQAAPAPMPGPADQALRIFWIDVEGGAATLVVAPTGETLLMDAGWPGPRDAGRIATTLESATGKRRLDYFVASHYH